MRLGRKKKYLDFTMEKKAKKIIAKNIMLRKKKTPTIDKAINKQLKRTPPKKNRKVKL